jgi:hypothetical protein
MTVYTFSSCSRCFLKKKKLSSFDKHYLRQLHFNKNQKKLIYRTRTTAIVHPHANTTPLLSVKPFIIAFPLVHSLSLSLSLSFCIPFFFFFCRNILSTLYVYLYTIIHQHCTQLHTGHKLCTRINKYMSIFINVYIYILKMYIINFQFHKKTLGYDKINVTAAKTLNSLYSNLQTMAKWYPGEGEPVIDFLMTVTAFLQTSHDLADLDQASVSFNNILSILLENNSIVNEKV